MGFDPILTAVAALLAANTTISGASITVDRRKKPAKWDTDRCPILYVSGGKGRDVEEIPGGYMIREYQVFAALLYAGNYQFRVNENVVPDMAKVIRSALLVSTLVGTKVWRSHAAESDEFDGPALDVGYELNVTEIWYKATEPR